MDRSPAPARHRMLGPAGLPPAADAAMALYFIRLGILDWITGLRDVLERTGELLADFGRVLPPRIALDIRQIEDLLRYADRFQRWAPRDVEYLKDRKLKNPYVALLFEPLPSPTDPWGWVAPQLKYLRQLALAALAPGDLVSESYKDKLDGALVELRRAHELDDLRAETVSRLPAGKFDLRSLLEHRRIVHSLRYQRDLDLDVDLLRACEVLADHILFYGSPLGPSIDASETGSKAHVLHARSPLTEGGEPEPLTYTRVRAGERGIEISDHLVSCAKQDAIFSSTLWHSWLESRPAVMDAEEIRLLSRVLADLAVAEDDLVFALVFRLVVALGLGVHDVLGLRFGNDGHITREGVIRRFIQMPPGSFQAATREAGAYVRGHSDVLEIALPPSVRQLLARALAERGGSTLGKALGLTKKEDADRYTQRIGKTLRKASGSRLDVGHLKRLLRDRVAMETEDPLAASLVTGPVASKPPVTLAYLTYTHSFLSAGYTAAATQLFTTPTH